ncbi:MAG: transporter [Hyphomicrobiales bacterium]|nr:transporter [Hyphomicrobiales bacterium]
MSIGWLAWELTGSTVWLGLIAFADLVPTAIVTILAGAIADRFGCVRIIRMSLLMTTILAATLGVLVLTGWITIELLLLIALLNGCAESLGQPARLAIVNALVGKRELPSAIAIGSASFNASRIIGPAIAGGLIVWTGTGVVMLLCAVSFLAFFLVIRTIRINDAPAPSKDQASLLREVALGFVYVMEHKGIRFVMILLTATSLLIRPVIELLPGVVEKVFHVGPTGLSLILGSIGAGAVVASLWLARRGESSGLTRLLVLSTLATGLAVALSMQFDQIWLAAIFFGVMGVFMLSGNVAAQTLIQNNVTPALRARVMGLFIVFGHGLPAVGALIQGWLATYVGLQAAIGGGALLMLGVWAWAFSLRKTMARELEHASPARRGDKGG